MPFFWVEPCFFSRLVCLCDNAFFSHPNKKKTTSHIYSHSFWYHTYIYIWHLLGKREPNKRNISRMLIFFLGVSLGEGGGSATPMKLLFHWLEKKTAPKGPKGQRAGPSRRPSKQFYINLRWSSNKWNMCRAGGGCRALRDFIVLAHAVALRASTKYLYILRLLIGILQINEKSYYE